jgi:hypothetical protein
LELHRQRTRQSDTVSPYPTQCFYDFFFRDSVVFVAEETLLLTHRGLSVDAAALPFLVALALLTVALDFFVTGFFRGALSPFSALGREVVGDANSRSSVSLSRDLAEPVPTLIIELLDWLRLLFVDTGILDGAGGSRLSPPVADSPSFRLSIRTSGNGTSCTAENTSYRFSASHSSRSTSRCT